MSECGCHTTEAVNAMKRQAFIGLQSELKAHYETLKERDRLTQELKASTEENKRLREELEIMGKTEGFSADTKIEQAKHIEALESDLAVVRAALEKLAEWEDIDSAALIRVRLFAKEALQRMGGETK